MKCKLLAISLLLTAAAALPPLNHAETVTQKEASKIARTFFNAAKQRVSANPKFVFNGKKFTTDRLFSPFYVYNHPEGGFVVIAADNKAFPVLCYSLEGSFNPDNIPEATVSKLREYSRDIEYIRHDARMPEEAISKWTDINRHIAELLYGPAESSSGHSMTESDGSNIRFISSATEFPEIGDAANIVSLVRHGIYGDTASIDAAGTRQDALLKWIGGGHFELLLPENVWLLRIYNIGGAMVRQQTFRNTAAAIFNLDSEPRGFYFAVAYGISGRPYGFKLYK